MSKLRINIISETAFSVQGHGVHTAYMENLTSLRKRDDVLVTTNVKTPADIIHIHTIGPYSLRFLLYGKAKLKFVSAHVVPDSFVGSLVGAKYWKPISAVYLRWFYNRADGVFAVSAEVVSELKKLGVKKPIYLVPNTINTTPYQVNAIKKAEIRKELKLDPNKFIIVSSGQVQPRKRVDSFIAAAKALPDMEFIWIGGIPFGGVAANHRAMQKLMDNHPDNVHFTGVIEHNQVVPYYQASDVFFLPSMQETFGIVIVEGAAAGLPVILRDNNQYKVTFEDWYLAGTDQTFVKLIKKLAQDKTTYKKWQVASAKIAQKYDSKTGADEIVDIYKKALEAEQ